MSNMGSVFAVSSPQNFSGWAGLCTSGSNCDIVDVRSSGFTCSAATCSGLGGGSGDGQFSVPTLVAFDSSGNLYLTDYGNNRVVKFSSLGSFVGWAGACTGGTNCVSSSHSNGFTCTFATCTGAGTSGSGDGQFNTPRDVAFDTSGNMYIADFGNARVVKFSGGVFSGWAGACTGGANCVGSTHSNGFTCTASTCSGLSGGSGDGQFNGPQGVGVDSLGNVYVADSTDNRVEKFGMAQPMVGVNVLSGFARNSTGQVLLVLGDFQLNPHGTKPVGVGFQSGRDTTPVGFISGMLTNNQPSEYDTNTGFINTTSGRPLVGGYSTIFVIGGPLINAASFYYQNTGVNADKAPVALKSSGGNYIWTDRNGTQVLSVTQSSDAVPPGSSDVSTIEIFQDSSGRTIVLMFGTTYMGTWAAAWYFKYVIYPNISTYTNGYYLIRWTDATTGPSANGVPDSGDTFTTLATAPN